MHTISYLRLLIFFSMAGIYTPIVHAEKHTKSSSVASKKRKKKKSKPKKKKKSQNIIPPAPRFLRYTSYASLFTSLGIIGAIVATIGIAMDNWSSLWKSIDKTSYQAKALTFIIVPLLFALPISWYQYTQED